MSQKTAILKIPKKEETKIAAVLKEAHEIRVECQADYDAATGFRKKIKVSITFLTDHFKDAVTKAKETVKAFEDTRNGLQKPLKDASAVVKLAQDSFLIIQREEREEKEREERAERQRLEDEAQAERDRAENERVAEVRRLAAAGKMKEAEEKITEPIETPEPPPPPPLSKPKALKMKGSKKYYFAEVDNFMDLVKAVAENKVSKDLLLPNMPGLNAIARDCKGEFVIPGVRFDYKEIAGL